MTVCRRADTHVTLRFPDPLGRRDESGRVIPHDIVVPPPLANDVRSLEDGQRLVWPLLADAFARLWDRPRPPPPADIYRALGNDPGGLGSGDATGVVAQRQIRASPPHCPRFRNRESRRLRMMLVGGSLVHRRYEEHRNR